MTEKTYHTIIESYIVKPIADPIYSETATTIRLQDESGGLFVEVEQSGRADIGKIAIMPTEWVQIRNAIDELMVFIKLGEVEK